MARPDPTTSICKSNMCHVSLNENFIDVGFHKPKKESIGGEGMLIHFILNERDAVGDGQVQSK